METAPEGVVRRVPEMTICATFTALGSLTARAPVNVAKGEMGLPPVQPWQAAQAPSNRCRPCASATTAPFFGEPGAGGASVAGRSGDACAGTVRTYVTMA